MDTGITDSLTNFYNQGVRRGYSKAKIDRLGLRALLFTAGWAMGVVTGLVATGWL
jgi:hypothetical protein